MPPQSQRRNSVYTPGTRTTSSKDPSRSTRRHSEYSTKQDESRYYGYGRSAYPSQSTPQYIRSQLYPMYRDQLARETVLQQQREQQLSQQQQQQQQEALAREQAREQARQQAREQRRQARERRTQQLHESLFKASRESFREVLHTRVESLLYQLYETGVYTQAATTNWQLKDATLDAWNKAIASSQTFNPEDETQVRFAPTVESWGNSERGVRFLLGSKIYKGDDVLTVEETVYDEPVLHEPQRGYTHLRTRPESST